MPNITYCLPIIQPTKAQVLATIKQHRTTYETIEVWLDYIEDLDTTFVRGLISDLGSTFIAVFRRQQLEAITMPLPQRLALLRLFDHAPSYVDLDITSQKPELQFAAEHGLQLNTIVSHHDYAETPDDLALGKRIAEIQAANPTILKIACLCRTNQDALRLLHWQLRLRDQGQRCIILGMGQHGLATRVFGTLWGNALAFAPKTLAQASAPGQLTRAQLQTIITILEGRS